MRKRIKSQRLDRAANVKPHGAKTVSNEDRHPKFSLRMLQGACGLDACEREERAALVDKFAALSQLTWSQIRQAPRHGLGYESINRNALTVSIPDDVKGETIIAFRFCGMAPMIGVRREATFYVLWLDRGFTAYHHG